MQRYTIVDPFGNIVNITLWDGDTSTWTPIAAYGAGYTARPAQALDAITTSISSIIPSTTLIIPSTIQVTIP